MSCCEMSYPSEAQPRLKFREISFISIMHFSRSIILKFYTEHASTTGVLCAQFQNDWVTEK